MTSPTKRAVIALVLCALADLAAAALLAESDSEASMTLVGVGVMAFGVLTLLAAYGISRLKSWAPPLALVTRVVDCLAALPGLGVGLGPAAAVVTIVILSAVSIIFVVKVRHAGRQIC